MKGIKMSGEGKTRRKSARIASLIQNEKDTRRRAAEAAAIARVSATPSSSSSVTNQTGPSKRRGRKKKNLAQVGGAEKNGNHSNGKGALQPVHPLPEKRFLDLAVDILQRRDRRDLFAHPVDDAEVEDYYLVIAEPMDFSTLRARLRAGFYKKIEQFEHDVLLISENAMFFNGETTVYYKQALAIFDLSQRVLETLKRDPEKLEQLERELSSRGRRRLVQSRRQGKPRAYRGLSSNLLVDQGGREINSGSQSNGAKEFISPRDSYKPAEFIVSEFIRGPKGFVPGDGFGIGYRDSLKRFVKNLGPVAQRVAAQKLSTMVPNLPSARSPLPAAASFLRQTNFSSTSSSDPRASSSSGGWRGRSSTDKGKNVLVDSPAPAPSEDIIQPEDRQFLREFLNDCRSMDYSNNNTAAAAAPGILRFDSPPAYQPTPVRDERLNFFNQVGSYHLSEAGTQNVNNHISGITTAGSYLHNQVLLHNQWTLGSGSWSGLNGATPTNIRRTTNSYVHASTYLRPSRFSGTIDSLHGLGSNHGYAGGSSQVNYLSPVVEPRGPTVFNPQVMDIPSVQQECQPMGSFLRLLTMDEEGTEDQEAQSAAAPDVEPMIHWGQNEESQMPLASYMEAPCAPSESISLGMGPSRNPYPQRFGLDQPGMDQQSEAAGPSQQVFGQWRSTLSRDPKEQQRQLMPPPGERSKRPPPPPGFY